MRRNKRALERARAVRDGIEAIRACHPDVLVGRINALNPDGTAVVEIEDAVYGEVPFLDPEVRRRAKPGMACYVGFLDRERQQHIILDLAPYVPGTAQELRMLTWPRWGRTELMPSSSEDGETVVSALGQLVYPMFGWDCDMARLADGYVWMLGREPLPLGGGLFNRGDWAFLRVAEEETGEFVQEAVLRLDPALSGTAWPCTFDLEATENELYAIAGWVSGDDL